MHAFPLALLLAVTSPDPPPAPTAAAAPAAADDPNLWLEDVLGDRALAWVKARNAESAKVLEQGDFAASEARILSILDSKERIPAVEQLGDRLYNFWKDAKNPRGLWRRTTLAEYRKPAPAWETVLDVDALAGAEQENWVWHGATCLRPGFRRCLLSLSRGGGDASVVREFDLVTKAFVKDGFALPEAKSRVSWAGPDELLVGTDFGPGSLTSSGYPRVVKRWRRGTPLAAAATVFEGQPGDVSVSGFHDPTKGFERDLVERGLTFFTNELHLVRGGKLVKIEKPDSAEASVWRELLLLTLRDDWATGGRTYPAGALVAIELERFLAGDRRLDVLFEPSERRSLDGYATTRRHVLVTELDNVRNRVTVLTREKGAWKRAPLPGVPGLAAVGVKAVDEETSDDYWLTVTDYLTPTALSRGAAGKGPAERLKQLPAFFDASGLEVAQHEAVSKDGTRVPYFQVSRKGLALDGKNPTLLYGYGGFEVSEQPSYRPGVGASWLEEGGVYVVANIRGGGEFGPKWHQAALKANRPRAYEDFFAVAEDLARRGVTSPAHLGIQGGSNGGLLVGNALTMRPELFGAVVCQVPLLDMKRYSHLLAGASWMGEYGDPDVPEEWAFIRTFSPYHNLRPGVRYPPVLFMTSTRDDRVHPGHARKMAARMIEAGHDVLYWENVEGGHGGAANNRQAAHMGALTYAFLWSKLR
ncbi:MAG: prolyl oligopeptidase family serine peptidase [Anaeromyxobacter sp.]